MFTVYGWSGVENAVTTLVLGINDGEKTADAVSFFRLGAAFALACGFLGTLIGFVITLQNMNDPSKLGPAMAVALLPQFYGILPAVAACYAAMVIARRQPVGESAAEKVTRGVVPAESIAVTVDTLVVLLAFCVLLIVLLQGAAPECSGTALPLDHFTIWPFNVP